MTDAKPITCPAPAPWSYDYNPYLLKDGTEIPAFEICDADQNRLFTTEELPRRICRKRTPDSQRAPPAFGTHSARA